MSFLIEQIREQKILEMEVAVDDFISENNISDRAVIHTMTFDKLVFAEETEVREYLKKVVYEWNPTITESENAFTAILIAESQIDMETEVEVELRRGVMAKAGDLLPVVSFEEIAFNDKGEINLSCKFGEIQLSEGLPYIIEIARVAEGEHPSYGKLKITEEHLESMERNFKSKVTGVDLAVNEDHRKNEAFGWFKDVFRSFDGQILYGQVLWNKKGIQALSEKEYRYFSPEFRFNYVHPHSQEEHGPTLLGGALTNYPFLKMEAITELNNKSGEIPMSDKTIDLKVHEEKLVELNTEINKKDAALNTANAKVSDLEKEVEKLKGDIELSEKKAINQKLFAEGKISKAQLDVMNEGGSLLDVLALNEKMNTKAAGDDNTKIDGEITLSEKEQKTANALGLTAEEYVKYGKGAE